MQEKILVLWDVMLDKYSYGIVKRLNPEWPNPLLNIEKEEYRLGGAANVAWNIASLNWNCDLIWLVGNDENKKIFENIVKDYNIKFHPIELENYQTIIKQRFIENTYKQQLLRVDYEKKEIKEDLIKWFSDEIIKKLKKLNPQIVVISDYAKWIINEYLVKKLKELSKENWFKILVDAKPYNWQLFKDVFLLKPNFKEFCQMIWKEIKNKDKQIEEFWLDFIKKMNINLVITRWKKWASLITKDWKYLHLETQAKEVFDVTWAWDTFIATIAYALANWQDLEEAIKLWNKASGIVIWKVGTEIIKKEELFIKEC